MEEDEPAEVADHVVASPVVPAPALDYRWVHAGSQTLDLLPTPITTASTLYKPFSSDESQRIETQWQSLPEQARRIAINEWGLGDGEGTTTAQKKKERPRSDSGASSTKGAGGMVDGEVIRSGEEQPKVDETDREGRYRDIMTEAQREYENLELIAGVPVSQVSRPQSGGG